jgi:hypothetical protein
LPALVPNGNLVSLSYIEEPVRLPPDGGPERPNAVAELFATGLALTCPERQAARVSAPTEPDDDDADACGRIAYSEDRRLATFVGLSAGAEAAHATSFWQRGHGRLGLPVDYRIKADFSVMLPRLLLKRIVNRADELRLYVLAATAFHGKRYQAFANFAVAPSPASAIRMWRSSRYGLVIPPGHLLGPIAAFEVSHDVIEWVLQHPGRKP